LANGRHDAKDLYLAADQGIDDAVSSFGEKSKAHIRHPCDGRTGLGKLFQLLWASYEPGDESSCGAGRRQRHETVDFVELFQSRVIPNDTQ